MSIQRPVHHLRYGISSQIDNSIISGSGLTIHGNGNIVDGSGLTIHGNDNTVEGSSFKVIGNDNRVGGYGAKVEGNRNTVKGSSVKVNGDSNRISSDWAKVDGNGNTVFGREVKVNGNNNHVSSEWAKVDGNGNTVSGGNVKVNGNNNHVSGERAKVNGSHNQVNGENARVDGNENRVTGTGARATGRGNTIDGVDAEEAMQLESQRLQQRQQELQQQLVGYEQLSQQQDLNLFQLIAYVRLQRDLQSLNMTLMLESSRAHSDQLILRQFWTMPDTPQQTLPLQPLQVQNVGGSPRQPARRQPIELILRGEDEQAQDENSEHCYFCLSNRAVVASNCCGKLTTCLECTRKLYEGKAVGEVKCMNCRKDVSQVLRIS